MGIIFYIKTWRLVLRDCELFLAYVHNVSIESLLLDTVPIVHDFLNIFPINLPELFLHMI